MIDDPVLRELQRIRYRQRNGTLPTLLLVVLGAGVFIVLLTRFLGFLERMGW